MIIWKEEYGNVWGYESHTKTFKCILPNGATGQGDCQKDALEHAMQRKVKE